MIKLSVSNIAWDAEQDENIYEFMRQHGFTGLEIAPTRIFPVKPYDKLTEAAEWSGNLRKMYGLSVSSMQSIWFGRQERLFGHESERKLLLDYTKKSIDFAAVIGCGNLVFGCPRNRKIPDKRFEADIAELAISFFRELGDYALAKGTILAMEAIPAVYNTNFINDTATALDFIKMVGSGGLLLNLDVGTMIANNELLSVIEDNVTYINHVHMSEPGLAPIQKRELHTKLMQMLKNSGYDGYVSIEMGKCNDTAPIQAAINYVEEICI